MIDTANLLASLMEARTERDQALRERNEAREQLAECRKWQHGAMTQLRGSGHLRAMIEAERDRAIEALRILATFIDTECECGIPKEVHVILRSVLGGP